MSQSRQKKSKPNIMQRFLRWVFGAPFEDMGAPFGDQVSPEMHKFEAEVEEITHLPRGEVMPNGAHHGRPHPSHK
jgi:hypothetical protein